MQRTVMQRKWAILSISLLLWGVTACTRAAADPAALQVGTSAVNLKADDAMVIAGGIGPGKAQGQEGELRATAVVLAEGPTKVAIVSCDVLMLTRDLLDPVAAEIESTCGIPASNVLIHTTHTHHAPEHDAACMLTTAMRRSAGKSNEAIVKAVREANERLTDATFCFQHAQETTVGQNSRLLLADGTIYWVGPRDDAVRPTGPFDPDLPVLAFRDAAGKNLAVIFGHSTHTIGGLTPGVRSPAFYGMAAQRMEQDLGGTFCFLEGASGSTHRLDGDAAEASKRIEAAVRAALAEARVQEHPPLAALKRPFTFHVRKFDEQAEEQAVTAYCNKRIGAAQAPRASSTSFGTCGRNWPRNRVRNDRRGSRRSASETWRSSVYRPSSSRAWAWKSNAARRSHNTFIAELSNDWIGYLPDREAYQLGGYQVWTGFHSYAEQGTGERMVDTALEMLQELKQKSADRSGALHACARASVRGVTVRQPLNAIEHRGRSGRRAVHGDLVLVATVGRIRAAVRPLAARVDIPWRAHGGVPCDFPTGRVLPAASCGRSPHHPVCWLRCRRRSIASRGGREGIRQSQPSPIRSLRLALSSASRTRK